MRVILRSVPGAIGILLFLLSASAATAQSPAEILRQADESLLRMDLDAACGKLVSLLDGGSPYTDIAWFRLERWAGKCSLLKHQERLWDAAGDCEGAPLTRWRAQQVARQVSTRYREAAPNPTMSADITPQVDQWLASPAPVTLAFSTQQWPVFPQESGAEGYATGGLAGTVYCFGNEVPGTVLFKLVFPNPGIAWLDGRHLTMVAPDAGLDYPVERFFHLNLTPGNHELKTLQAVESQVEKVSLSVMTDSKIAFRECLDRKPAGWSETKPPKASSNDLLANAWLALSLKQVPAGPIDFGGVSGLLLNLAAREESDWQAGDSLPAVLGNWLVDSTDCLPLLKMVRSHLDSGELPQAETWLEQADEACLTTADGLLLQAEFAQLQHWGALEEDYLKLAAGRFKDRCDVMERWFDNRRNVGIVLDPEQGAVHCEGIARTVRSSKAQTGKMTFPSTPEEFRTVLQNAGRSTRIRLLEFLYQQRKAELWRDEYDKFVLTDPQTAWTMTEFALARGNEDEAGRLARVTAGHRETWGGLRSQAGKVFLWKELKSYLTPVDGVIDDYLAGEFAAGMPRVVVLDEAVILPAHNGWYTYVETMVVHVNSPEAAEAVGEISIAAGEELALLAVRKADGTWLGPEEPDDMAFKETISLPGLAAGDFMVLRTVREVPPAAGAGGCPNLPPFYFAHREDYMFKSRYVVVRPPPGATIVSGGQAVSAQQDDNAWFFSVDRIAPIPDEPGCPDPEHGLDWVHVISPCMQWSRVRDQFSDRLTSYCNGLEVAAQFGTRPAADKLFKWTVRHVSPDGTGLLASPFSKIVDEGQGNRLMALYCSLIQTGHDAHLVAVQTAASRPIDYDRPGLGYFDGMVVHVAGSTDRWYDPYDLLASPGILRPKLRNRPGLILTPLYPKLFLRTPGTTEVDEGWEIQVEAHVDQTGVLSGTIRLSARGAAAADLDRNLRDADDENRDRLSQAVVGQVFPSARAAGIEVNYVAGDVEIVTVLDGQVDLASGGRLLILLPPLPAGGGGGLSTRTSPLYYAGSLPTSVEVNLTVGRSLMLRAETGTESLSTDFGSGERKVVLDGRSLEILRSGQAPVALVRPEDYPDFIHYQAQARKLSSLNVELVDERRD